MLLERKVLLKDLFVRELLFLVLYWIRGWDWQTCAINDDELFHIPPCTHSCTQWPVESRQLKQSLALQRRIQGESWGGCNPPFGKFSNLSSYPCQSLFHTKNNIKRYNVRSSQNRSLQEDCSYSSSWLLNHPNARSLFWRRSPRLPSALCRAIDYSK